MKVTLPNFSMFSPSVEEGSLLYPIYPLKKKISKPPVFLLHSGLLVPVCVPARRGRRRCCRKMLKYEQKTLPVNDLKVCSWKREGERVSVLYLGRNKYNTTKVTGYSNDVWMET